MDQDEKESQVLQPILQGSIAFHGKPLIAVRLPDGEFGVVLRWMCGKTIMTRCQGLCNGKWTLRTGAETLILVWMD